MSSVGISFGSATSGTGFDVTTTVNSVLALQRAPETAWATQTTALQAQDTVLSTLGSDVAALSTALGTLTSADGAFAQKQGASSDTTAVALISVAAAAQTGTHTVAVQRLATTSQAYSSSVAGGDTVSGTFTLQTANATSATSFNVAPGTTLPQLATQIDDSSAGITASVVSDSSGSRLSLQSGTGGSAGEITTGGSLTSAGTGSALSFTESQTGADAQYSVDGIALTSGSNTVTSALDGVTFQLVSTTTGNVQVQVAPDTSGIATALGNFVTAYNTLTSALSAQEGNDSNGKAEPLFGSTTVSAVQEALADAVNFARPAGSGSLSLDQFGITLGITGALTLDTGTLTQTLASHFDAAATTFQSGGDFGQNFVTALNNAGSSGNGILALAQAANTTQETQLATNKTNLEARLATYQTDLTAQLNTANQILQAIPQQLSGITQLFDAITGNQSSS